MADRVHIKLSFNYVLERKHLHVFNAWLTISAKFDGEAELEDEKTIIIYHNSDSPEELARALKEWENYGQTILDGTQK